MRRSDPCRAFREVFRQSWLIALTSRPGVHIWTVISRIGLHGESAGRTRSRSGDGPASREGPRPGDVGRERAASRCGTTSSRKRSGTPNDRSSALPPALIGPPRRLDTDRRAPHCKSLPSDSDDATFDAIAANGKPVSLPEAIKLAFRHQPRLRAQLESIAQAAG